MPVSYTHLDVYKRQVLLPVAWLLSKTGNVDAVWWSFPIAELFSVALCLLLYRRVDRNMLQKL